MDREEDELYFTNDDLEDPESPVSLQEPVISAEEVICEIEAMMEEVSVLDYVMFCLVKVHNSRLLLDVCS